MFGFMNSGKSKPVKKGLKIIIVGCGKVGTTLVEQLSKEGHDIIIIDKNAKKVQEIANMYDIMGIVGNGASYSVQMDAGIEETDLIISVTESDELNLLCCTVAKQVGDCAAIARVRTPDYSKEAGYLRETSSCIFEYYWFLDIKAENEKSLNQLRFEKLEVKNVCFAYPEGKDVLKNVSFSLYKGKHIAIVGENGSGKTTLVKLISGVYMPSKGEILINGIKVDPQIAVDFRGLFALMNQNYIKYKGDVKENIFLSAPHLREDKNRMQDLLSSSALSEDGLTLDLTLGREYDGAELSEGQWQQLAFLRALFKRYEIILLDEPTSAIDSENEHKLLAGFVKAMQDKSAVIVTHRLSLCRFADEILFLDGGRIVERGSHDELMEKGGKYCRMYEMQSKWYK